MKMISFSSLIKVYQVLLVLFKKRVSQITNKSYKFLVKIYTFHVISHGENNFGKEPQGRLVSSLPWLKYYFI